MLLAALLAVACGPAPADVVPWEACADLSCRQAWAEATWEADPQAVIRAVADHPDELEQVALVNALVETRVGETRALCGALQPGAARQRCEVLNSRMHLVHDQPPAPADAVRAAPGPASWRLDVRGLPPSPLADAVVDPDPCAGGPDERECRMRNARVEAANGDVRRAAGLCLGVSDPTWRAECAFQAAERRVLDNPGRPEVLVGAVDLCLLADRFADNCLAHIPLRIAQSVPPVDAAPAASWATLEAQAAALHAALEARGAADLARDVDGLVWAEAMGQAYTSARAVVGDPLDHLPERAWPHVRAAAAVALVRAQPEGQVRSLAALHAALAQALARRGPVAEPAGPALGPWRPTADLWPRDEPGDEEIPALVYLGASRRAWAAQDVDADLRICLLEAWVHLRPDGASLLAEGAGDPHPLVAWTAARLERQGKRLSGRSRRGGGGPVGPPPPGVGGPPPGTRAPGPPPGGAVDQNSAPGTR